MEALENETGGVTIEVTPGDRLSDVPATHAQLLTPEIRGIFADGPRYFLGVAEAAPFPAMSEWLRRLVAEGNWRLVLHRSGYSDDGRAGFEWGSAAIRGAEVGPPAAGRRRAGPLGELFALIGYLDWMGFGVTGELHPPVPVLDERADWIESGPRVDLSRTLAWGEFNGDHLIAAPSDFGGWITMNGDVVPLGTVADAIEWVFRALLSNRSPILD